MKNNETDLLFAEYVQRVVKVYFSDSCSARFKSCFGLIALMIILYILTQSCIIQLAPVADDMRFELDYSEGEACRVNLSS